MGRHQNVIEHRQPSVSAAAPAPRRKIRKTSSLPVFASFAALAFVLVSVTSPMSQYQAAAAEIQAEIQALPTQTLAPAGAGNAALVRDGYTVTSKPKPVPVVVPVAPVSSRGGTSAPAAGTPDPGSAKAIAFDMVQARGWGEEQYSCLVSLWQKESGWNTFAANKSSGAYGIPQSLPGSKMASAGGDWATNPATQITWGLGYITARYGDPCGAYGASQSKGWY